MPDTLPPVWEIEEQTKAKHQILEEYLKAWFPIIGRWQGRILYVDGFAGPGTYKNGEDGSPIIAIRTALEHNMLSENTKITFAFIEQNKERSEILKKILKEKFTNLPDRFYYEVDTSEFTKRLGTLLDIIDADGAKLAPTFAFLDPFGYSDIPITLIGRFLEHEKCEVLITFMTGFVNRFLDPTHERAITALYGSEKWKEARLITETNERLNFLLNLYIEQLQIVTGVKYVRSFRMIRSDNHEVYNLIFCTNHWKGLEVMKKAMLKVDRRGTYTFSGRLGFAQTFLFDNTDESTWMPQIAQKIFQRFKGQTVNVEAIHKFVITDTDNIFKKEILKYLEKQNPSLILNVTKRKTKALSYPDGCHIQFAS